MFRSLSREDYCEQCSMGFCTIFLGDPDYGGAKGWQVCCKTKRSHPLRRSRGAHAGLQGVRALHAPRPALPGSSVLQETPACPKAVPRASPLWVLRAPAVSPGAWGRDLV